MKTAIHRIGLAAGAALFLVGCGAGGSNEEAAAKDPSYVAIETRDGALDGAFNPAGYSASQIKSWAKALCKGNRIASFAQQRVEGGAVKFTAACPGGTVFERGSSRLVKNDDGSHEFATVTSVSGALAMVTVPLN